MPSQPVVLRRWQIAAAFVALTISFVYVGVVGTNASHNASDAARSAKATARKAVREARGLQEVQRRIASVRVEQLAQIHAQEIRSCRSRHKLDFALRHLIAQSIAQTRPLLKHPIPGFSQAAIRRAIRNDEEALATLRSADCLAVPPLPPTPPATP